MEQSAGELAAKTDTYGCVLEKKIADVGRVAAIFTSNCPARMTEVLYLFVGFEITLPRTPGCLLGVAQHIGAPYVGSFSLAVVRVCTVAWLQAGFIDRGSSLPVQRRWNLEISDTLC